MRNHLIICIFCSILLALPVAVTAQYINLSMDTERSVLIDNVIDIHGTSSHLYVLSETEGMAVFRAQNDSLKWLYTSSGMQRRGYNLQGDIRFSYLYNDDNRLSVLEPTSVLGVFSSTQLSSELRGVARLGDHIYLALGEGGLGRLSLANPESVDSTPDIVFNDILQRNRILDVISSISSNQLFVLTDKRKVHVFVLIEGDIKLTNTIDLKPEIIDLFIDDDKIWGTTDDNQVFEIFADGTTRMTGKVGTSITDILSAGNITFIRTEDGSLWYAKDGQKLRLWKKSNQEYQITKAGSAIWMHTTGSVVPVIIDNASSVSEASVDITEIDDQIITFPHPLLLELDLQSGDPEDVTFSYNSSIDNARIRDQGFFWQPTVNQVGFHWFTIIARSASGEIDSTRFSVEVRTFNAPPRFSPVRRTSIAVNETYELTITATDPESQSSGLIRYIGVDLPDGASIEEQNGIFKWTPTPKQVGTHTFKVIATDKMGAASSQEITITVLDISRQGEG